MSGSQHGRIVVSGLTKRYKRLPVVDDLSFTVEPGRVTGFLGPNGAGKTTTLRMLLGLVRSDAGSATISGVRYADLDEPSRHVGAVLEASSVHRQRSGLDHLRIVAAAIGVSDERAAQMLALTGLGEAGDRLFKEYSLGMRQRLAIATAMMGNPQVLVLDEPMNGLDPEGIKWMRDLLIAMADHGRTVLVSSHLLTEMQVFADDIVIIAAGRLVRQGSATGLTDSATVAHVVRVRTPDPQALATAVAAHGGEAISEADGSVLVTGMLAAAVGAAAFTAGVELHELVDQRPDLERVFLNLTHEKAGIR